MELHIPIPEFSGRLLGWYRKSKRLLPWRDRPEPYRVWVSEIMLQQTQVKAVLPYFERFLEQFPTVNDLAATQVEQVLAAWSGLGYYRRARNLHAAARRVVEEHNGVFPNEFSQVLKLPGIGRYTAGAILSIAFGQSYPVLDGNVRRVMARFLRVETSGSQAERNYWRLLEKMVADTSVGDSISDFNQALMELGATVCTPRNPNCTECPVQYACLAREAGIQETLPRPARKRPTEIQHFLVIVARKGEKYLLWQNRDPNLLEGFWEFPRIPGQPGPAFELRLQEALGKELEVVRVLAPVRHQITYRKLHLHPVICRWNGVDKSRCIWGQPRKSTLPFPSYVQKIVSKVEEQDLKQGGMNGPI